MGRTLPIWSVLALGQASVAVPLVMLVPVGIAPTAALFAAGRCVCVGPPLFASAPRLRWVTLVCEPGPGVAPMQVASDEFDEGVVAQEVRKGYKIDGKVLRHARVIVSTGSAGEDDERNSGKDE